MLRGDGATLRCEERLGRLRRRRHDDPVRKYVELCCCLSLSPPWCCTASQCLVEILGRVLRCRADRSLTRTSTYKKSRSLEGGFLGVTEEAFFLWFVTNKFWKKLPFTRSLVPRIFLCSTVGRSSLLFLFSEKLSQELEPSEVDFVFRTLLAQTQFR